MLIENFCLNFCAYGTRRSLSLKVAFLFVSRRIGMSGPSNSGDVTVPGSFSAPVDNFLPLWTKTVRGGGCKYVRGDIKDL